MNIAAALREIKQLKGKIANVSSKLRGAVVYDTKDEPAFKFDALIESRESYVKRLLGLETAVAKSNAMGMCSNGELAISVLRRLQELKGEIALYSSLPSQVKAERSVESVSHDYDYSTAPPRRVEKKTVTTYVCALTEADKERKVADLQSEFERLNMILETFNHKTDIGL